MNRHVSANRSNTCEPNIDNDRRDTNVSKAARRQGMRDNVKKLLRVNCQSNGRLLLRSELFNSKRNSKEGMLSLALEIRKIPMTDFASHGRQLECSVGELGLNCKLLESYASECVRMS